MKMCIDFQNGYVIRNCRAEMRPPVKLHKEIVQQGQVG